MPNFVHQRTSASKDSEEWPNPRHNDPWRLAMCEYNGRFRRVYGVWGCGCWGFREFGV